MTEDANDKTQQQTSTVPITPLHRDMISTGPIIKDEMSAETLTLTPPITKQKHQM